MLMNAVQAPFCAFKYNFPKYLLVGVANKTKFITRMKEHVSTFYLIPNLWQWMLYKQRFVHLALIFSKYLLEGVANITKFIPRMRAYNFMTKAPIFIKLVSNESYKYLLSFSLKILQLCHAHFQTFTQIKCKLL